MNDPKSHASPDDDSRFGGPMSSNSEPSNAGGGMSPAGGSLSQESGDDCCSAFGEADSDSLSPEVDSANGRVQLWVDRWLDDVLHSDRRNSDPALVDADSDGADSDGAGFDGAEFDGAEFEGDKARIADLAFLNALLEAVHRPQGSLVAQRVDRVMNVIRSTDQVADQFANEREAADLADSQKPRPATRRTAAALPTWVWPLFSTAAVLLLAAGIYWNSGSHPTARAAVLRASVDAARLADREYHALADLQNPSGSITRTESTLWVRGGEKFVLEHPWMGGHVTIGNNGHRAWFVPLLGLPSQDDDPQQSVWWAHKAGWALPDLTVRGLIESLVDDFDLQLLPNEALPAHPGIVCQHIRGIRRSPEVNRFQVIELWAHPQTGVAQRIVLYWDRPADLAGPERIQVDLVAERPQSDVWYEPESHPPVYPLPLLLPILPNLQP